jgi:serine/threonine protein kinase
MSSEPSVAQGAIHAEVHVFVGHEHVTTYAVPPGEYLIGSDPSCHLRVDAEGMCAMHARLIFKGHRVLVEPLEDGGMVFIEGERVHLATPLQPGTEIHIGGARLCLSLTEAALRFIRESLSDPTLGLEAAKLELSGERYRVIGAVGQGGMGIVLKSLDQRVRRNVAVKMLKGGAAYSGENLMRFIAEGQLTGELEHPNIVPVYDLGLDGDGQAFYAMKFVDGVTLHSVLDGLRAGDEAMRARFSLAELLTIFQKVCDAVAYAHSRGVIHRDLKPGNVMIGEFGEVMLMDWGLAKRTAEPVADGKGPTLTGVEIAEAVGAGVRSPKAGGGEMKSFETLDGYVVGTPPYLSPEQASGAVDKIGGCSDIYVLGIILFEILTLRQPFSGECVEDVLLAIQTGRFMSPLEFNRREMRADGVELGHCPGGRVPEGLAAVVVKAMSADRVDRYGSVGELQQEVKDYQNGFPTKAEQAGFVKHLGAFLQRHRREAILVTVFLLVAQITAVMVFVRIRDDEKKLRIKTVEQTETITRLETLLAQLRETGKNNYEDAIDLYNRGFNKEALDHIDLAVAGEGGREGYTPFYPLFHKLRGDILMQMGELDLARESYQAAADADPSTINLERIDEDILVARESGERPQKRIYTFKKQAAGGAKKMGLDAPSSSVTPNKPMGAEMREHREMKRAAKSEKP